MRWRLITIRLTWDIFCYTATLLLIATISLRIHHRPGTQNKELILDLSLMTRLGRKQGIHRIGNHQIHTHSSSSFRPTANPLSQPSAPIAPDSPADLLLRADRQLCVITSDCGVRQGNRLSHLL